MRQFSANNYNVAWFKLSEVITRGEKERALGLFRLLSHSFEDQALCYKLEGDLLLAFGDDLALEKYQAAAHHYSAEGRTREALMVYEHIALVKPELDEYWYLLLNTHVSERNDAQVDLYIERWIYYLCEQLKFERAFSVLEEWKSRLSLHRIIKQYYYSVHKKLEHSAEFTQELENVIDTLIEYGVELNEKQELQKFMLTLQALNKDAYRYAMKKI